MMSSSTNSSEGHRGATLQKKAYLNPKALLKRYPLPVAAYLRTQNGPHGLDLSQPLLIYTSYRSTKVRCRSLKVFREGTLAPVGPPLVMPEAYSGWFSLITNDGRTATYYSSVDQVASADVSIFLTRYEIPAYVIMENDFGMTSFRRILIGGGTVLKLLGVFEDYTSRFSDSPTTPITTPIGCMKYAQCLHFTNQVVYLSFNSTGRFYVPGSSASSRRPHHVYLISHIVKNFKLPLTVKLVCGHLPRPPSSFTGLLRLEKIQREEVMLACTMTSQAQATLFEIEVDSEFMFLPVTDPLFAKTPIFLKTLSYCQDEAELWLRQIKVTHHVTERRSNSPSRSFSDKLVDPLSRAKPFSLAIFRDHQRRKTKEKPLKEKMEDAWLKRRKKGNKKSSAAKHEPYIFQLLRKQQRSISGDPSGPSSRRAENRRLSRSFDNLDYRRVMDDINPVAARRDFDLEEDFGDPSENLYETIDELIGPTEEQVLEANLDDTDEDSTSDSDLKDPETFVSLEDDLESKSSNERWKKESVDSGHGCDYDESYFSLDYREANDPSFIEERNSKVEVVNKSRPAERKNTYSSTKSSCYESGIDLSYHNDSHEGSPYSDSNGKPSTTELGWNGKPSATELGWNGKPSTTELGWNGKPSATELGWNGKPSATELGGNGKPSATELGWNGKPSATELGWNDCDIKSTACGSSEPAFRNYTKSPSTDIINEAHLETKQTADEEDKKVRNDKRTPNLTATKGNFLEDVRGGSKINIDTLWLDSDLLLDEKSLAQFGETLDKRSQMKRGENVQQSKMTGVDFPDENNSNNADVISIINKNNKLHDKNEIEGNAWQNLTFPQGNRQNINSNLFSSLHHRRESLTKGKDEEEVKVDHADAEGVTEFTNGIATEGGGSGSHKEWNNDTSICNGDVLSVNYSGDNNFNDYIGNNGEVDGGRTQRKTKRNEGIIMRGNTVVIRIKDSEPKRPRITEVTFQDRTIDYQVDRANVLVSISQNESATLSSNLVKDMPNRTPGSELHDSHSPEETLKLTVDPKSQKLNATFGIQSSRSIHSGSDKSDEFSSCHLQKAKVTLRRSKSLINFTVGQDSSINSNLAPITPSNDIKTVCNSDVGDTCVIDRANCEEEKHVQETSHAHKMLEQLKNNVTDKRTNDLNKYMVNNDFENKANSDNYLFCNFDVKRFQSINTSTELNVGRDLSSKETSLIIKSGSRSQLLKVISCTNTILEKDSRLTSRTKTDPNGTSEKDGRLIFPVIENSLIKISDSHVTPMVRKSTSYDAWTKGRISCIRRSSSLDSFFNSKFPIKCERREESQDCIMKANVLEITYSSMPTYL